MTVRHSFDLYEYIAATTSPEVAAAMASSVAWRIDILIVQAARQLFKQVREVQHENSLDTLAELNITLGAQIAAERAFEEAGSTTEGPIATIQELSPLAEGWHGLSAKLTELTYDYKGFPRQYARKCIEEQITSPEVIKVGSGTKARMRRSAERKAEMFGEPDAVDQLYNNGVRRSELRAADMVEALKAQSRGVVHMLHLAQRLDVGRVPSSNFQNLAVETQRILIDAAQGAAERAETYAVENRGLSDSDYDLISLSAFKVVKDLRAELKHPRFVAQAAQLVAGEKMTG